MGTQTKKLAALDASGKLPTANLGIGLADNKTALRGNQSWAATPGGLKIIGVIGGHTIDTDPTAIANVKWEQCTHATYVGITITSATNMTLIQYAGYALTQLSSLVTACHAVGTKVLVVFAGNADGRLASALGNSGYRATLVTNIATFISTYSLDGIDLDWETDDFDSALLATFVDDLYAVLNPIGQLIIADAYHQGSLAWDSDVPTVATVAKLDWLAIMCYDMAYPSPRPDHAPYYESIDTIMRYVSQGYPVGKLVFGIPAYASDDTQNLTSYKEVIDALAPLNSADSGAIANINDFDGTPAAVSGGILGWNGVDTVIHKTRFANAYGMAGVMLFEAGYDKLNDTRSLLQNIYDNRLATMSIYNQPIAASTDDCLVTFNTTDSYFSIDLTSAISGAGRDSSTGYSLWKQGCGLRFINIPADFKNSTILYGCLKITAKEDPAGGDTANSVIIGEAADTPAVFSDIANYQARRGTVVGGANNNNITTASVVWNAIMHWVLEYQYDSPDIKTILHEISNRASLGTTLVLYWDDHAGSSTANYAERLGYSYNGSTTKCARLYMEYIPKPISTELINPGEIRTASGALAAGNANAITFAWHDPELHDIQVRKVVVEITNAGGTPASTIKVGIADNAAGTNLGAEFFTAINANAATILDSYLTGDTGAQTKWVLCQDNVSATDGWIVGQILTQNAASLAGRYYIEYSGR